MAYPLVMNTGRIRDQWHTMTRTGSSARLMQHVSEPFCQFHPDDAPGVQTGDLLRVSSSHGWLQLRAKPDDLQPRGSIFVPIHWNSRFSQQARVDALVAPHTDPLSGQPESKHMPVNLMKWRAAWHAELFIRGEGFAPPTTAYWSLITQPGITHFTLADSSLPEDWTAWLSEYYSLEGKITQSARIGDEGFNLLVWAQGELHLAFYARRRPLMPDRQEVLAAFTAPPETAQQRLALLAGQAASHKASTGNIICSCFSVGETQIVDAVRQGCHSVQQLGASLKCGTNCGSCLPELKRMIADQIATLTMEERQ